VTIQSKAITAAQNLIGYMQQFQTLRSQINEFLAEYNSENYSAMWAAFATAPENPDGTLGSPDASPNTAHPITVSGINRSQQALVAGVTFIQDFQRFLTNQAVSTLQRSQTIDDLVS
jgi:hypothetical protein